MKKINKVSVAENLLVGVGKSSRLTAISNKLIAKNNIQNPDFNNKHYQLNTRLKPETKIALEQANNKIDERVLVILSSFPAAKKNSLFKLRFGVGIDNIKDMTIKQVFFLLGLDASRIRHFKLIENLDKKGMSIVDRDK